MLVWRGGEGERGKGGRTYRNQKRNYSDWHCVCCNHHHRRDYRRRTGWDCGRACCCSCVSCCCVCRRRRSQRRRRRSRLDLRRQRTVSAGGGSAIAIATCSGSGPCGARSGGIWSGAAWSGGLRGCRLWRRLRRRGSPLWCGGWESGCLVRCDGLSLVWWSGK